MTKLINKTVDIVFFLLLAIILLAMAVSLAETVFSGPIAFIIGTVLLAMTFFVAFRWKSWFLNLGREIKRHLDPIPVWKLALFLGLFSAITKILLVFLFNNNADYHPDMAMYRSFAEQYAETGRIIENSGYAWCFNYTAFYGLIFSPIAKLFGSDTKVFTVTLTVMHSVALVLLFDMLRCRVEKSISFSVLLLYSVLPMGLLQTQLFTHENALFFFHILSLWLFLRAFREGTPLIAQIGYIIISIAVLSIGKSVNAAGRVFFISFGIYAVAKSCLHKLKLENFIRLLCVCLSLIVFYFGSAFVSDQIRAATVDENPEISTKMQYEVPFGWGLYLGLNYDSKGTWTEEDRDTYYYYRAFDSREEAVQYQKHLLKQRLQMYEDNPIIIPKHLFNKIKVLWGSQLLPFAYEQGNAINHFVLYGMGGIINKICILVNKVSFLLLYVILMLSQWKKMTNKKNEVGPDLHFRMAIIGITFALMLVEVMPKYASHLHICFFGSLALMAKDYFKYDFVREK